MHTSLSLETGGTDNTEQAPGIGTPATLAFSPVAANSLEEIIAAEPSTTQTNTNHMEVDGSPPPAIQPMETTEGDNSELDNQGDIQATGPNNTASETPIAESKTAEHWEGTPTPDPALALSQVTLGDSGDHSAPDPVSEVDDLEVKDRNSGKTLAALKPPSVEAESQEITLTSPDEASAAAQSSELAIETESQKDVTPVGEDYEFLNATNESEYELLDGPVGDDDASTTDDLGDIDL